MTKENKTNVEDTETSQETKDNQITELSDIDLETVVGGKKDISVQEGKTLTFD